MTHIVTKGLIISDKARKPVQKTILVVPRKGETLFSSSPFSLLNNDTSFRKELKSRLVIKMMANEEGIGPSPSLTVIGTEAASFGPSLAGRLTHIGVSFLFVSGAGIFHFGEVIAPNASRAGFVCVDRQKEPIS